MILAAIILLTAGFFVHLKIDHPLWMLTFLVLTSLTFSMFGFINGLWADGFEKLQLVPLIIVTPLTFLGCSFYSINIGRAHVYTPVHNAHHECRPLIANKQIVRRLL